MENKTYSLSELAREFGSSKDLIKGELTKSEDTSDFQKQVLQKLTGIQEQLEQLTSSNKQSKPLSLDDELSGLSEAIGDISEAFCIQRFRTAHKGNRGEL